MNDATLDPVAVLDRERPLVAEEGRRIDERAAHDRQQMQLATAVRRTLAVLSQPYEGEDRVDLLKFVAAIHHFVEALEATGAFYDALNDPRVDPSAQAIVRLALEEADPLRLRINNSARELLRSEPHLKQVRAGWDQMARLGLEALAAETNRRFPSPEPRRRP
jgi:hypothetical protein